MKIIIILICLIISIILWRKYIQFENYVDESLNYFDWKYYINNNPDIPEDINSYELAKEHYINTGKYLNYLVYPVTYGSNKNKSYLSILAIFKNETMIIETWIKHYIWQGVDHIYLIDNDSNDNPLDILQPYIDSGYITLYQLPGKYKQMTHFKYVYEKEKLQENTTWLMNIDVDEYMYCKDCDIKKELYNYEKYYVIYTQWKVFGSNNLELQPKDPRISFTFRHNNLSWHSKKYLIQTKHIKLDNFHNTPHKILKIDNNKIIDLPNIFMLNHYQIMSLEYFKKVKMSRGDVDYDERDNMRNLDYFNEINKHATFEDNDLKILVYKHLYKIDINNTPSISDFDWKYYINNNPDIPNDIKNEEKALEHYKKYGISKNYKINPIIFDNSNNKKVYLSIISQFKNEGMIMDVWIKHHIWQGVEHFYLIDNNSDDNSVEILKPYIDDGIVTLYQLPGKYKQNIHVPYVYGKEKLPEKTKWVIYIDTDEYFYCMKGNIRDNLKNYENYSGIHAYWKDFGSNGLTTQPKDPRTAFTTRRPNYNKEGKCIIQTDYITEYDFDYHPHWFSKIDKNILTLPEIFRLNHYRIMSLEYFQKVKMTRGSPTFKNQDTNFRTIDYFKKYDEGNTFIDLDLRNLVIENSEEYE